MFIDRHRVFKCRTDAVGGIGFAENISLERKNAVIVGGSTPEHGAGGHQAALNALDGFQMAGAACVSRNAQITRIDKADEFLRLLIQLRIGAFRIGRTRCIPDLGEARTYVRASHRHSIEPVVLSFIFGTLRLYDRDIAAVAVGAAQHNARIGMHGVTVGAGMTGHAAK